MQQRKSFDDQESKFSFWRVPGGRLEPGERIEHCLERELKEELGISIRPLRFIGFGQDTVIHKTAGKVSRVVLYFLAETEERPEPREEGIEQMEWVELEKLREMEIEPAMKDMLERFHAGDGYDAICRNSG